MISRDFRQSTAPIHPFRSIAVAVVAVLGATACSAKNGVQTASCGLRESQIGKFVKLPAGAFVAGLDGIYSEEGPPHEVNVASFEIQSHEVTNGQFAHFVEATGYKTDAERTSESGAPDGGSALFAQGAENGWRLVSGATWRTPEGPGSNIADRNFYPVVHVTLNDARAYARWAQGRLPTEAEWEYAATLGMENPAIGTSGAYDAKARPIANTWQGAFPVVNTADDGFSGAAPVGCFAANRVGLFDMIGNVWELTDTPFADEAHTIKGGSFLCAKNFCGRFRPAARQPQENDFSTNHIGFRIVRAQ